MHFYEKMEREIDFQKEYEKIEEIVCNEYYLTDSYGRATINTWIENHFSKWEKRQAYTTFRELRDQCGFPVLVKNGELCFRKNVSIDDYFLYIEMLVNLFHDLRETSYIEKEMGKRIAFILQTIGFNLEQLGVEIKRIKDEYQIVSKNPVVTEIVDNFEDVRDEIVDEIVEYNRYLLKGNLLRKGEILGQIVKSLEPKRKTLDRINDRATEDFFFLANKMNIRHNNTDPLDKNYVEAFDKLSSDEKEAWYDLIYDQGLMLYVLLEGEKRKEKIEEFKRRLEKME